MINKPITDIVQSSYKDHCYFTVTVLSKNTAIKYFTKIPVDDRNHYKNIMQNLTKENTENFDQIFT